MNEKIYWGEKPLSELGKSHLSNIIQWIDRNKFNQDTFNTLDRLYTPVFKLLYISVWEAYKSAATKTINGNTNLRLEYHIIETFKLLNEKDFRKGNWKTQREVIEDASYRILNKHHENEVCEDMYIETYTDYLRYKGE